MALGTLVAWYHTGQFHAGYFILALFGVVFIHAGTNLANDYFDHKSRADEINKQHTRFSGGSRVIQEGLMAPRAIARASFVFFGLAVLIGLYLAYLRGPAILVIGAIGLASGYFYSATPLNLGSRGCGELLVGINCGPLVVLGAYYLQAQSFNLQALAASVPVGLLMAAVLYINQFPDVEADKAANKNTLVVRMGTARAIKGFYLLLVCAYLAIVIGCVSGLIPSLGLIALLSAPLAWRAARSAGENHASGSGARLVPAMAGTIGTHLVTGILLCSGYLAAGIVK